MDERIVKTIIPGVALHPWRAPEETTLSGGYMARDDLIQTEGVIKKSLGFGNFEIETKEGHTIQAKMAGRMKKYKIKIMVGDKVKVSISPYDVTHGIITYRL